MVSAPATAAIGIDASATARSRSATISTGRRAMRSTHTPVGSAKSKKGSSSTVPRSATRNADACSTSTATSGRARFETCEPSRLTVCPAQSRTKSRWRRSAPPRLTPRRLRRVENERLERKRRLGRRFRERAQLADRRDRDRNAGEHPAGRGAEQRRTEPDRLRDDTAECRADRDGPPVHEPRDRIHAAEQSLRRDRLAERQLVDVLEEADERAGRAADREQRQWIRVRRRWNRDQHQR